MTGEHEPVLGTGLSLLDLFGFSSTAAKIIIALIVIPFATYFFVRFRYPCRSPSSLMQVVEQAKKLFNECHSSNAFEVGEYDKFNVLLCQITSRASEISARPRPSDHQSDDEPGSLQKIRDTLERLCVLWVQLKDIVKCHREARLLIRDLEICKMRASHSHANFQLHNRRAEVPPVDV
ncbi:hypothetical protein L218DRAFT_1006832 [Marasmius fiardii PR-910]|nr:hypothetical protein L218DRAFT_1006832 [Marasmius fiardii PR-910]